MNRGMMLWLIVLLVGGASLIGWERQRTQRIHSALDAFRGDSDRLAALALRKKELESLQVPESELAQLRRDHEDLVRLKAALTKLGNESVRDEILRRAVATTADSSRIRKDDEPAPAFSRDAGTGSPRNVLETVVWAANSGNVEALTLLIAFQADGRKTAEALFRRLPSDVQSEYGSPEKIYATLLAANLPLGLTGATTVREHSAADETATLSVRLERLAGRSHEAEFSFRRAGGGWQLVIPDHVVETYAKELAGNATPAAQPPPSS